AWPQEQPAPPSESRDTVRYPSSGRCCTTGPELSMKCRLLMIVTLTGMFLASPAMAADSAESKDTRLILLGTQGGARVNADRAQPSNVLIVNGTPYLIDAGNGVARQLSLAHVPLLSIHQIFITHNHDDHNAD